MFNLKKIFECVTFKILIVKLIFLYNYLFVLYKKMSGKFVERVHIVNTRNGPVKGRTCLTVFSEEVWEFHKIPYMKPPIGELRFKDPQPVDDWTAVIDGVLESSSLPNINGLSKMYDGDENAATINVFTKNLHPPKLLPVMIYIHGGGFSRGSSSVNIYSPDFLIQKDIVFFSFNYRLGALGFLSLDNPKFDIPGNAGLKDQTLAMKWIKDNCELFGGDPNNITIFGESAGGCSVHYHLVSNISKGLFHKAIVMSGCVLNNWSLVPRRNFGLRLAKVLGWNEDEPEEKAVELLYKASPKDIVLAQESLLTPEEKRERILFAFGPIVEPYMGEQCFIPEDPLEMVKKAWSYNIPLMIGATSDEGLFSYAQERLLERPEIFDQLEGFEYLVPVELGLDRNSAECKKFGATLKKLYYQNEVPSVGNAQNYVNLMTDKLFLHGIHCSIRIRLNDPRNSAPTYYYRFNFDSPTFNHFKIYFCRVSHKGSCHADDLSYVFKNAFYHFSGGLKPNSAEYKTMQSMVGILTSFAERTDPNCSEIEPVVWEPVKRDRLPYKCLNISDELSFIDHPEHDRVMAWEKAYEELNSKE